ncbi:glycosyl hydrolase family 18 protein, partial [Enterococcus faecium]|uniref:glycosyl hydrolase family 18 protein n=1 Tax=Enterococcus faecium TaxID=1352 RepID=UPI0023B2B470
NAKLGVSLGGWSKSGDFTEVAADAGKRRNFVSNVMKFIKYTDMDYVDVDWEYPTNVRQPDLVDNKNDEGTPKAVPADKENYLILMEELKAALDKQGKELEKDYELTTAIHGSKEHLEQQTDVQRLFNIVDFANLMTYDFNGSWGEVTGHQTALYTNPEDPTGYSIDSVVQYLLEKDVSPDKIVVGTAYYSRGWDTAEIGNDRNLPGLFEEAKITNKDADESPSRGANNEVDAVVGDFGRKGGVWSYRNLDELKKSIPDLTEYWDDVAQAPYLYSESTKDFYTFDNVESVQKKAEYVKEHQLGGMIAWMASQDKETDNKGIRDELAKASSESLFENGELPKEEVANNLKVDVDVAIKLGTVDSGKNGFEFTLNNKEILEAYKGDALQLADRFYSTLKKPRLVITTVDNQPLIKGNSTAGNVTTKDGKTIVDLSSVYEGKLIQPGA